MPKVESTNEVLCKNKGVVRRRTMKVLYDLPDGNITVNFPKFISELKAVSDHYKTDSISQLISVLQGFCLAEGIKPVWGRWTSQDTRDEVNRKAQQERALRMVERRKQLRAEREANGAFADRVTKTRNRMGDY